MEFDDLSLRRKIIEQRHKQNIGPMKIGSEEYWYDLDTVSFHEPTFVDSIKDKLFMWCLK